MAPRASDRAAALRAALALAACLLCGCRSQAPAARSPAAEETQPAGRSAGTAGRPADLLPGSGAGSGTGEALLRLEPDPVRENGEPQLPALLAAGSRSFAAGDWQEAYRLYLGAVNRSPPQVPAVVWLRLAQIAHYENRDPERAGFYHLQVAAGELSPADRELWERIGRRLARRSLSAADIGLGDGNVSALAGDGDDLWIGTWNGGVARYSLAAARAQVFRAGRESILPATVRCIRVTPGRVWIGTYQGLFVYSKATSAWQEVAAFGGSEPQKVEALAWAAGRLYVGTLGAGLWRQSGEGWERLAAGARPGDFITCLEPDGGRLLVGTLNQGVLLLDLAREGLRSFDALSRGMEARNITMLLSDPPDGFWIGTYGQGVYHWDGRAQRLSRYSRAGGQLGDDWVLCGTRTRSGLYFGTLGGGLARHDPLTGSWSRLGLERGVAARDISALAYAPPLLYVGTLGSGVIALTEARR